MNAKVSIIVPVYNVAPYLSECIDSVLVQTYGNLEIILVDDGSCDGSSECCDSYAERDERIKVIHKENGGLVSARKAGVKCVTGEYIFNLDGDDWIEPNTIETCIRRIEIDNSDILQFGYCTFGNNQNGTFSNLDTTLTIGSGSINDVVSDLLLTHVYLNTLMGTKIYRTGLFKDIYDRLPDHIVRADDLLVFVMALPHTKKVTAIENCFLHYRMRSDSKSHIHNGMSQVIDFDNTIYHVYKFIKNNSFYDNVSESILDNWAVSFKIRQLNNDIEYYDEHIPVYKIGSIDKFKGKRVVLYGAGNVGKDYYRQLSLYNDISIVSWADKDPSRYRYDYYNISRIEDAIKCDYDYIIIAVKKEEIAKEIRTDLMRRESVLENAVLWEEPCNIWETLS